MLTPTPSIDRMPGLLALYGDRLKPQDKTPLAFMKARFGIVDEPLVKAIDKKDTTTMAMFGPGDHVVPQVRSDGWVQGYHHTNKLASPPNRVGQPTAKYSATHLPGNYPDKLATAAKGTTITTLYRAALLPGEDLVPLDPPTKEKPNPPMVSPAFRAAKRQGNGVAAAFVVGATIKQKVIDEIKSKLIPGVPVVFVPVMHKDQGDSGNAIPRLYAEALSHSIPGQIDQGIVKVSGKPNTGATVKARAGNEQEFDGDVRHGVQYVVVDDTFTTGSTVVALTDHITQHGGTVSAITTIAASKYQNYIRHRPQDAEKVLAMAGVSKVQFDHETGIQFDSLTGAEIYRLANLDGRWRGLSLVRERFSKRSRIPAGGSSADRSGREVGIQAIPATSGSPELNPPGDKLAKAFPTVLFFKGGTPGTPGLYQKLITDKHGKKVTQWVKLPKGYTAAHNEAQAELFNIDGTPYESLETRPDTTDKQRHVGMDALAALKRRVNLLRASGGSAATLLGSRLYASFVASGHAELTGQKITSPQDLAALAQVYRDPRFETFRCVFLKGDTVVGESAYTSRLPGTVHLPDNYTRQVEADFKRFGATGYYMLHNHPSGKAMPSKSDERLTEELNRAVSGMKAHVVIDHSEYGLITKEGRVSVVQKPDLAGPDYHSSPSLDHPMLGVKLGGPADVAMAAKALAAELKGGGAVLVMTKGFECKVDLLASVPHALMDTITATMSKRTRAKAWLRGIGRASGAGSHTFLVVSDADYDGRKEALKALIAGGSFTDVVSSSGKSMMATDWVFTPHGAGVFKDQRTGFKVAQTLASDLETQEKYLTDGATQLGYADIDDLAMNDYPAFEKLAVQWRMDHPVETALYQPQATYGVLFKAPEVRNAAGKLLAPNGQPSKLTEGQWHQVRSPEFMRWFGAWKSKPTDQVQVVKASILGIDHTDTEAVRRWLTSSPEFKYPVLNADSGIEVNFSNGNLKDSLKRRGEDQRSGYTVLREMIETAKFAGFEAANRSNIKGQDIYFSAMELNGKLYSVRIKADVRHDKSTAYKDHRVNEIDYISDIEVLPAVNKGGAVGALGYPGDTGPTRSGSTVSLALLMQSDKFESSKVVDENGEPKVLYHGTSADITEFNANRVGDNFPEASVGFYFSSSPEAASDYAKTAAEYSDIPSANVMPVYLSIKNPYRLDGGDWALDDDSALLRKIKSEGKYDGVVSTGKGGKTTYIAFNPTQIKSAIGNNGDYGTNPVITKSQPRIIFFKKAPA